MIVATAPIRPDATTIGYHVDSLFSFDVSAISFAISALIFASSAWVISLALMFLPFGMCGSRTIRYPMQKSIALLGLYVNADKRLNSGNYKIISQPFLREGL